MILWVSAFVLGPFPQAAAPPWVGLSSDQIEKMLGEQATASMATGGTENLQVMRYYVNARLVVWYGGPDGVAVAVHRAKERRR
ncbi:hypothetical protein J8F10_11485 [Gemmata sp. G18]|uniref:Uncharacterized protein n=1 Tax=Gemmata palustris TaxID=2822762 RepID=A0ABS5BQD6_9BACT|nr:hypothetical protein [Gemmata palustris]MBP3955907.1 hypothetical protein [Gemmata palustris]